ncbi:MAG TPA: hypothetical protein VJZ91_07810 [Blastocatellia bacterium]|nr:hypothetical protein [Blastocatellia bacterium]
MKSLTGLQKALLAWSVVFLLAAEGAKALQLGGRAAKLIGLTELLLAIATGVAVGLAASFKKA